MSRIYDAAFAAGKSVNPMSAFDRGYYEATKGQGGADPAATVRNHYENKLRKYLKSLPADVDMSAIPAKYQGKLSEFLTNKKMEYVQAANNVDEMEVGSQGYIETVAKMNAIKNTFTNLDQQFKLYGETKTSVVESIEGQTTSLYGENIANVNMLRSIFNEEYEINIDDNGNLNFVGEDGEISLNDLPDFYQKDYQTADAMMKMGSTVYQNALKTGVPLAKDGIQYFQYANKLKQLIDQSGNAGIMSILHDGLVGDIVMANDEIMQKALQSYNSGDLSFAGLRDLVVDNYMKVLIKQSLTGSSQRKVSPSNSSKGGTVTERKAAKKIEMIDDAFINLEQGGDTSSLTRLFGTGWNIRFDENDSAILIIEKSSGDQWKEESRINVNSPNAIQDLYRYAGVDPSYWPSEVTKKDKDPLNPND